MTIKALLLAAGKGERLRPFTNILPKCLMPINGTPLLSIWVNMLLLNNIDKILINTCYLKNEMHLFLKRSKFKKNVIFSSEEKLLGTAGTIKENFSFLKNNTILLAHADNLCITDFSLFIRAHKNRPKNCLITMMTFDTNDPKSCGIVETDKNNVLKNFYEKIESPPSSKANGAVYLLAPEVIDWIVSNDRVSDFSNDVIPHFLDRIYCWHNTDNHIDIGNPESYYKAKNIKIPRELLEFNDDWSKYFDNHEIHTLIKEYYEHRK